MRAATGSSRSSPRSAGRSTAPRPTSRRAWRCAGWCRCRRAVELQANGLWFSDDRERGTALSAITTRGADASLRLVGNGAWRWSALAYVQTRDFTNSFASVNAARDAVVRVAEQYDVPSTGLGARFEVRPPVGSGVELRLGGDWRETVGETRELFNFQNGVGTRRRLAGGRTRTVGGFAEAALERGALTLTGGARIDRWWIRDGFLDERVIATGAVLNDLEFADRSGWQPTARAGACGARDRHAHAAQRSLSRLAAADAQRTLSPVPRRRRRDRRQSRIVVRAAARRRSGDRLSARCRPRGSA